jgi:hypothetical protein
VIRPLPLLAVVATLAMTGTMVQLRGQSAHSNMPGAISFFAPFFIPKVLQDEYRLKEFILSGEFATLRRDRGDRAAVDTIFDHALELSWGNVYEALLLSFVVTVEHRNFGVRVPVLGPVLWFPLTSEFPEQFAERVRALPEKLYGDSPASGDRDKLQHFFGSAFLTYVTESRDPADRMGVFVEWGEDRFVVEGALDNRDLRANRQGQNFGLWLLADETIRPSFFLRPSPLAPATGCGPDSLQNVESIITEER